MIFSIFLWFYISMTAWSKVLVENLTVVELVKKYPPFINHESIHKGPKLGILCARWIQSLYRYHMCLKHFHVSSRLWACLTSSLFSRCFPLKSLYTLIVFTAVKISSVVLYMWRCPFRRSLVLPLSTLKSEAASFSETPVTTMKYIRCHNSAE